MRQYYMIVLMLIVVAVPGCARQQQSRVNRIPSTKQLLVVAEETLRESARLTDNLHKNGVLGDAAFIRMQQRFQELVRRYNVLVRFHRGGDSLREKDVSILIDDIHDLLTIVKSLASK